jgi:hypothetical protein
MGLARDSALGPKRARGLAHPTWPSRVHPRPMFGIAPAAPLRFPETPARADPKIPSLIPVPPGLRPHRQQPKLLDRLREALRSRDYSPRIEQMTYAHVLTRGPAALRRPVDGL